MSFKQRLALRKKKQELKKSGMFESDMSNTMRRMPQTSRAGNQGFNSNNLSINMLKEIAELDAQEMEAKKGLLRLISHDIPENAPLTPVMGKSAFAAR